MKDNWGNNYKRLKDYFAKNGPTWIKGDRSTPLGIWVKNQRQSRTTMPQERRQLLDDIEFPWRMERKKNNAHNNEINRLKNIIQEKDTQIYKLLHQINDLEHKLKQSLIGNETNNNTSTRDFEDVDNVSTTNMTNSNYECTDVLLGYTNSIVTKAGYNCSLYDSSSNLKQHSEIRSNETTASSTEQFTGEKKNKRTIFLDNMFLDAIQS